MNSDDVILDELLTKIDNIDLIPDEELEKMDFFDLAYYMQTLNQIDALGNNDMIEGEE